MAGTVRTSQVLAVAEISGASLWISQVLALAELVPIDAPTATGIAAGTPTVGSPTLGTIHVLTATAVVTGAPTLDGPTLGQIHALAADGIATGASTVGSPDLALAGGQDDLTAAGIATGAPTVGSPTLAHVHVLTADGIATGAPTVGSPDLALNIGQDDLEALGITTGAPTVGTPGVIPAVHVSQVLAIAEISGAALWTSQVLAIAEIANDSLRVSQVLVIAELELIPPMPAGRKRTPGTQRAPEAQPETPAQAQAQAQIQAGLATARARMAPGTVLRVAGATPRNSGDTMIVRQVAVTVGIDWDRNGTYTDATADLISYRGSQSLTPPGQALAGGSGTTDRATVVLNNTSRKYSTRNTQSTLYSLIADGAYVQAPVRLGVTIDSTTTYVFTGVLRALTEQAATPTTPASVTLDVRSRDDLLLQRKMSTPIADWVASQGAGYTEDYHIIALLEAASQVGGAAGWVDGSDFVSPEYADAHPGTLRTIDPGLYPLLYVWLDDEPVLSKLWAIAAACGGWLYTDGSGKLHYHNQAGMLEPMLEQQFGARDTLALDPSLITGLSIAYNDSDLFSKITIETAPRSSGRDVELWRPDNPLVVPPNDSSVVQAILDNPAIDFTGLTWQARTGGGLDISGSVTITGAYSAQRVELTITNNADTNAYISGLAIQGVELAEDRTSEISAAVATNDAFWQYRQPRERAVRSELIQNDTHARTLADYLLDRASRPQLIATANGIDDPTATIGRLVEIDYGDTVDDTIAGVIVGVDWSGDRTGFRLNARVMALDGVWTAVTPYFVIGTHKLGNSGAAGEAYLFY